MKAAEAIITEAARKESSSKKPGATNPNEINWSQEKAIQDWENEGGALGVHGSIFSS
jgi:hypothetical protein